VKKFLFNTAQRIAPRTFSNLRSLSSLQLSALEKEFDQGPARFIHYERELRNLRREIDELRRDNRRVAELYDVVFEWAHRNAAERGVAPIADQAATVARVADVMADTQVGAVDGGEPNPTSAQT